MASTLTRKRPRTAAKARRENRASVNERYLVDTHGKRVAIVLPLAEYQWLVTGKRKPAAMSAAERVRLLELALQAKGSGGKAKEPARQLKSCGGCATSGNAKRG